MREEIDAELERLRQSVMYPLGTHPAQNVGVWAHPYEAARQSESPWAEMSCSPVSAKAEAVIKRLMDNLPFALAARLHYIRFIAERPGRPDTWRFVVDFPGGKSLTFTNIDTFPTDADITRIAMEAP